MDTTQTDKADRQADIQTDRQAGRETDMSRESALLFWISSCELLAERDRQEVKQVDRQTDRQTGRHEVVNEGKQKTD